MQPLDIGRLVTVSQPALSPDGRLVAYVVQRVDLPSNRYRSAVWLAPTDGSGDPWPVTSGAVRDEAPAWSPDGRRLAVARDGGREAPERERYGLHVVPVATGGEVVRLAARDEPVTDVAWSPDGRWLAFASRVRDARYDEPDETARPPRRVDRLFPRLDSVGWTVDRPEQVHVVPADGSADPRPVTGGAVEHTAPAWSPDSSRLAVVAARHADADLDVVNDLWVVDVAERPGGGLPEPRALTTTDGTLARPSWSPDGSLVAVLRTTGRIGHRHARVAVVPVAGGPVRTITAGLDRTCAPFPGERPPLWVDGALLTSVEDGGSVHVVRVPLDGGDPEVVVGGERWVTGFDARAGVLALTGSSPSRPSELSVVDGWDAPRTGARERRLTGHQDAFVAVCPPVLPERLAVTSEDGTALDAWLLRPAGGPGAAGAGERLPLVLSVHGGPHTQWGGAWFDEHQLYAGAGYAVAYANPHGSTGGTESFARSILSPLSPEDPGTGWGGIDYRDLLAVVDAALDQHPDLDPDRVAVVGGSYGGFMTSWAVGHTDRFRAAVSERAVNNLASLEWSSDAAGYFRHVLGVSHLDEPAEYARMSPVSYARDIRTPVLVLHSEDDLRCHVEQADCLWVALRLLRREVEYVRFPGETHELTRSGSPRHRVQRAELVLDFLARRLGGAVRQTGAR